MNTSATILAIINITVGLPEIIIFLSAAILLGFSIHFYWAGRKTIPNAIDEDFNPDVISASDEWRLQFYEQIEKQEQAKEKLETELNNARNNEKLLLRQMEELQNELSVLEQDFSERMESKEQVYIDYTAEMERAQQNLRDNSDQIAHLLQEIDQLKEAEGKNIEILKSNDTLNNEIRELRHSLLAKESEIKQIQQREVLSNEMHERLEQAHDEFRLLQEKLKKLEGYISDPYARNFEYNELQQTYFHVIQESDEMKIRNLSLLEKNQQLTRSLWEVEAKLLDSNFNQQQLAKKVAYLEELTNDLQQLSGHNRKLEMQLKRINEIENIINKASEENRK